jgi:hypothetical protein
MGGTGPGPAQPPLHRAGGGNALSYPERFAVLVGKAVKGYAETRTRPHALISAGRNPLYHWTRLELQRYVGIAGKAGRDTVKPGFFLKLRIAGCEILNCEILNSSINSTIMLY